MKNLLKYTLILFTVLLISGCNQRPFEPSIPSMISVSSDGRYALSSHYGRYLILWDIEKKTQQIINRHTNIYSPYFIPNTHSFLWQDANSNAVHIQTTSGVQIKSFDPGFAVYGHIMSENYRYYVAEDDNWQLFRIVDGKSTVMKRNFQFYSGTSRILNLSHSMNYLLTSGDGFPFNRARYPLSLGDSYKDIYEGLPDGANHSLLDDVVLWDLESGKPIKKFYGNVAKTMADLSPDANYVVGVDENGLAFIWQVRAGTRQDIMNPINPDFSCFSQDCKEQLAYNIKTNVPMPADFYSHPNANGPKSVAVKFIDEQGHFIRFIETANYATLHHVSTPKVQAYMPFGKKPQPHVFSPFSSANVIDTAPKAKILVMAQTSIGMPKGKGTGIIVYQFDEKTKTLKRLWAPEGPPPHRRITNKDNPWEG